MVSTPKKEQYRTPLDPYNGMEEPDIRPSNILKELSDGEKNASKPIQNDGEKPKTKNRKTHESSFDILRRRERNQSNETFSSQGQQSFRNSVRGKNRTIGKGGRTRGLFTRAVSACGIPTRARRSSSPSRRTARFGPSSRISTSRCATARDCRAQFWKKDRRAETDALRIS